MADLINFRTVSGNLNLIFYKITSGAITFSVKSENSATIMLATKPVLADESTYELVIEPFKCTLGITNDEDYLVAARTNEIMLSGNEFKKYWILWRNKEIAFGMGHTVLIRYQSNGNDIPKPNYVTFYPSCGRDNSTQWQFYVSPVIDDLPLKPLSGGEPHWVQVEDMLPDGALIGGYENEFLYIMRAHWRGSLTPGKFVPSLGLGFIAWGGSSHECDTLEILSGYNCTWVPSHDNGVPPDAVEGGHSEVNHEVLYVGRVHYKGHLIVGKVQPSHSCCYFPYEDQELSANKFEVLVVPHIRKHGIVSPIDV